jgi:hypothetical protein
LGPAHCAGDDHPENSATAQPFLEPIVGLGQFGLKTVAQPDFGKTVRNRFSLIQQGAMGT